VRKVNNISGFFAISPDVLLLIHMPPIATSDGVQRAGRAPRHPAHEPNHQQIYSAGAPDKHFTVK
jgi:hypothetical protein